MNKSPLFFVVLIFFILFSYDVSLAQCAMCKATTTSNLEGGGSVAKGINKGILYLMSVPYVILFLIFRKKIGALFKMLHSKNFPK